MANVMLDSEPVSDPVSESLNVASFWTILTAVPDWELSLATFVGNGLDPWRLFSGNNDVTSGSWDTGDGRSVGVSWTLSSCPKEGVRKQSGHRVSGSEEYPYPIVLDSDNRGSFEFSNSPSLGTKH